MSREQREREIGRRSWGPFLLWVPAHILIIIFLGWPWWGMSLALWFGWAAGACVAYGWGLDHGIQIAEEARAQVQAWYEEWTA